MATKITSNNMQSPVTAENENLMAALSYLLWFISGVFFLVIEKDNQFVRFHAAQSTVVFGVIFIVSFIPILGWVLSVFLMPFSFILTAFLMWKAYSREKYKLPVAGNWAEKLLAKWPK